MAALTADKLLDVQIRMAKVVGDKPAAVIAAWMGGAPPKAMLGGSLKPLQSFGWSDVLIPIKGLAKVWQTTAGVAGYVAGGGKIYTIEDAVPGGPPIEEALALLAIKDSLLWSEAVGFGQGHRNKLAAQMDKKHPDVVAAADRFVNAAGKAAVKAATEAAGGAVKTLDAGAKVADFVGRHWRPIALVVGAVAVVGGTAAFLFLHPAGIATRVALTRGAKAALPS